MAFKLKKWAIGDFTKAIIQVLLSNFTALIASSISTLLLAKSLGINDFGRLGLLLVVQNVFMIPIKALQPGLLICYNELLKVTELEEVKFWKQQLQHDFTLRVIVSICLLVLSIVAYGLFVIGFDWQLNSWPLFLFIFIQSVGFAFEKKILLNFQMQKKFFYFSILASLSRVVKGVLFSILFFLGVLNLTTAIAVTAFSSVLIVVFQLKEFLEFRPKYFVQVFKNVFLIKKSVWPGLCELVVQLGSRSGVFVLQSVGGLVSVGIFTFSEILIGALAQVSHAVISVFSPKILETNSRKDLNHLFVKMGLGGGLGLMIISFLSLPMIELILPEKYSLVWLCFVCMSPGLAASFVASLPVVKLHGLQKQKELFLIETMGVIVTLAGLAFVELAYHAAIAWSVGRVLYMLGAFYLWFYSKTPLIRNKV